MQCGEGRGQQAEGRADSTQHRHIKRGTQPRGELAQNAEKTNIAQSLQYSEVIIVFKFYWSIRSGRGDTSIPTTQPLTRPQLCTQAAITPDATRRADEGRQAGENTPTHTPTPRTMFFASRFAPAATSAVTIDANPFKAAT